MNGDGQSDKDNRYRRITNKKSIKTKRVKCL